MFGRRLRAAWLQPETRKVLLGYRNRNITSHYSALEIEELLVAASRGCKGTSRKSSALTIFKRKTAWINPLHSFATRRSGGRIRTCNVRVMRPVNYYYMAPALQLLLTAFVLFL